MTTPNNDQGNNNSNEINDASLYDLYQKRKRQHASPNAVRQEVIKTLSTNAHNSAALKHPWWKIDIKSYVQISAVACSLAIAIVVINFEGVNKQAIPIALESAEPMMLQSATLADYQTIEWHVLAPKVKVEQLAASRFSQTSTSRARKIQYESAKNDYLARQADIEVHQQSFAKVLNTEEGLSLLTCNHNLLKLSQEVVDLLLPRQERNTIKFSKGQMVALTFDRSGHIITIKNPSKKTEC